MRACAGTRRRDRELYVPRSWTCAPHRCRAAGLGGATVFATKPELAARMIGRFVDAGQRVGWVPGDEVYGSNPKLRTALEERQVGCVLAVACSHEVTTSAGRFRADALAAKVPKRAWQKLSAGAGAKGHRFYDWAVIDLAEPRPGSRQLLIRRNRTTGELAYYRCFCPAPVSLAAPGRVAGSRWRVEETFPSGKGLAGLDEHQVRSAPRGRELSPPWPSPLGGRADHVVAVRVPSAAPALRAEARTLGFTAIAVMLICLRRLGVSAGR